MSGHEAYIKPPCRITIRDPSEWDKERGQHELVLGRENLDTVFLLTDEELVLLCREADNRIVEKGV